MSKPGIANHNYARGQAKQKRKQAETISTPRLRFDNVKSSEIILSMKIVGDAYIVTTQNNKYRISQSDFYKSVPSIGATLFQNNFGKWVAEKQM